MHWWNIDFSMVYDLAAGYENLAVAAKLRGERALGAVSGKANRAVRLATTVSASGTVPIDFAALSGPAGETIVLDEVYLVIGVIKTAGGTGTLAKGASNGFTGFGSDWTFQIYGGAPFALPCGNGLTVDSTHKTATFTNTGSGSIDIELYVLGRDG